MKDILKLLDTANIVSSDKIDIESLMSATDLTLVLENLVLLSGFLDVDIYNKVVLSTCLDDLKDAIIKIKPWLDKNSVSFLVSLPKPDLLAEMCVELPVPKEDKGVFTDGKAPIMHRFLKGIAHFNSQLDHLDPVKFRRCFTQFKSFNLVTSENLISLVCYNNFLLDLLPQISITQPILTDFFKICESEIGETSGIQRRLENYVAKLRAESDKKGRQAEALFQTFFASSQPQSRPHPPENSALIAIKEIIREGRYPHKVLFRAFHTDHHNKTLKDAFTQLKIKQTSVKKEYHFLFKDEILLSEAMFLTLVQELIPFIKGLKELNVELKESGAASTCILRAGTY